MRYFIVFFIVNFRFISLLWLVSLMCVLYVYILSVGFCMIVNLSPPVQLNALSFNFR